jgi:hypothetical protein
MGPTPPVIACVGPRCVLIGRAGRWRPVAVCPYKNPRSEPSCRKPPLRRSEQRRPKRQATGPSSSSPHRSLVRAVPHHRLLHAAGRLAPRAWLQLTATLTPFSVVVGGCAPLLDIELHQSARVVPAPSPPLLHLEHKPKVATGGLKLRAPAEAQLKPSSVSQRRAAALLSILHVVSHHRRHSVAKFERTRRRGEATPLQAGIAPARANQRRRRELAFLFYTCPSSNFENL